MKFIPRKNLTDSQAREGSLLMSATEETGQVFYRVKSVTTDQMVLEVSMLKRKPRNFKGTVIPISTDIVYETEKDARAHQKEWEKAEAKRAADTADGSAEGFAADDAEPSDRSAHFVRDIVAYLAVAGSLFGESGRGMKTAIIYRGCHSGFSTSEIWNGLQALNVHWSGAPNQWTTTKGCTARRRAEWTKEEPKVDKSAARYGWRSVPTAA